MGSPAPRNGIFCMLWMAQAGQHAASSHAEGLGALEDAPVSADRRPAAAGAAVRAGGACVANGLRFPPSRAREAQKRKANAPCRGRAMARTGRSLCSHLMVLAGVHVLALAASTFVQPARALSTKLQSPSAAPIPFPPLPLCASNTRGAGCMADGLFQATSEGTARDPAMMLHLRGGEEPRTPSGASRKRSFADSAKTAPAPAAGKNNNHKRPASGMTIARAKEAATRLYKEGSEMVPTLAQVRELPTKTYASAAKRLRKVPAVLREQKRKFDAIPREVLIKSVVLPAVGVSSVVAVACALHIMGHGATLVLMLQAWLERARALGAEAWEVRAVGASM